MGKRFVTLTTTFLAVVLGLMLNSVLLAGNSSETDHAIGDKRVADYMLARENCNALSSDERDACRADAKAKFVAMIGHGTSVHAYARYTEKLRLFPDFPLIRGGLR